MKASDRAKLRAQMRRRIDQFWAAELAHHDDAVGKGLQVSGVFLDTKDGQPRVVIVCHVDCDAAKIQAVAAQYFAEFPSKVIYREHHPRASLDGGRPILDALGGFGTLGGFFQVNGRGPVLGISNNHVLSGCNVLQIGQPIQDTFGNPVGDLFYFAVLNPPPSSNVADVALVKLHGGVKGSWRPRFPMGFMPPRAGLRVTKVGGATGVQTFGLVRSMGSVNMRLCGDRVFQFTNIVAVEGLGGAFSIGGDSGAVVMTENGFIVGLLFGVLDDFSYMVPFTTLAPLRLTIA